MRWISLALALALTIFDAPIVSGAQIAAVPCASGESVARATAAMQPFFAWPTREAPSAAGYVLLDCRVVAHQRLACSASSQTPSPYDLGGAAVAFASELEVCPGTPRHLMLPLTFRADGGARPAPSP
jgi:hypothetical protein